MENLLETGALYGLSHDTLIPRHESIWEIEFFSHMERLDGLVVEYWAVKCNVPGSITGPGT